MSASSGNSEARREALALALASGLTVKAAAVQARVSLRSAHTYRAEPTFAERVERHRHGVFDRAVGKLARLCGRAASELAKLLRDPDSRVRLGAAKAIFDAGFRGREVVDLGQRMANLLAALEAGEMAKGTTCQSAVN
jgi:hypothetical protein